MSSLEGCSICSGPLSERAVVQIQDFRLLACNSCGSWNAAPRPTPQFQHAFHDTEAYSEHPYLQHRRARPDLVDRRCAMIFGRLSKVADLSNLRGEPVLDIGCDSGAFILSAARQFGIRPLGVDVARRGIEFAKNAGVEAYLCSLEGAPPGLRDLPVITAVDLIEHVAHPALFFESMSDRLRKGGVAYVETPNVDSAVYVLGRRLCGLTRGHPLQIFQRLFPLEHIQYFSCEGISRLAKANGLRVRSLQSRVLGPPT